jgi:hypothetical protein
MPKKGWGCWEQQAAPSLAKRSIAVTSSARSRSKSHCAGSAAKSSGTEGELRRMGLSSRNTSGLISQPIAFPGNDARLGWMTPVAICNPAVQCARVWATVMLPHCRSLSGWRRLMRCFISSTRVGSNRSFKAVALSGRHSRLPEAACISVAPFVCAKTDRRASTDQRFSVVLRRPRSPCARRRGTGDIA